VEFTDIPIGLYTIEVGFSQDFLTATKKVQLLIEPAIKEYKIFIGLKPRTEIFAEFKFFNKTSDSKEFIDPERVEAKCIFIPERCTK
jgi:hypothetical protein